MSCDAVEARGGTRTSGVTWRDALWLYYKALLHNVGCGSMITTCTADTHFWQNDVAFEKYLFCEKAIKENC